MRKYERDRLDSGAVYTAFEIGLALTGWSASRLKPREEEQLASLAKLSNWIICYCNDLISVPNELEAGVMENHVIVLLGEGYSLKRAFSNTGRRCNELMVDFQKRVDAFLDGRSSKAARDYVELMRAWNGGSLIWYLNNPRYVATART